MSESAPQPQSFTHRELDFGGPLATLEWSGGDGTPLLLIHGADGSAANWLDIAPLLRAERRVVAVDLPGFGRSPVAGRKPSMDAYGKLVCELIERELGGRAVIAGNSMGAVVAVLAASSAGEAVAATSLVAPAVPRAGSLPVDPTMAPMLVPFLVPGLAGLEARRRHGLPAERRVRDLLTMCYASGNRESDDAFAEMVDVARNRERSDQVQGWSKAFRSLLSALVAGSPRSLGRQGERDLRAGADHRGRRRPDHPRPLHRRSPGPPPHLDGRTPTRSRPRPPVGSPQANGLRSRAPDG